MALFLRTALCDQLSTSFPAIRYLDMFLHGTLFEHVSHAFPTLAANKTIIRGEDMMTFERPWVQLRKLTLFGREATVEVLLYSFNTPTTNYGKREWLSKAAVSSLLTLKFNSPKPGTSIPAAPMRSPCSH